MKDPKTHLMKHTQVSAAAFNAMQALQAAKDAMRMVRDLKRTMLAWHIGHLL